MTGLPVDPEDVQALACRECGAKMAYDDAVRHMDAAQLGRTTEVSGIRMVNTANGDIWNILAHKRMVSYVTSNNKGYRIRHGDSPVLAARDG